MLDKALGPRRHLSTLAGISCLELRQQRHREIGFLSFSISTQPAENRWVGLLSDFQADCNRCQTGKAQGKVCTLSIFRFLSFFPLPYPWIYFLPKPLPEIFLWKSEFDIPLFSLWCWFRIILSLFLKQSQALLACPGKCCLSRGDGVSYHCRLSDRDNAELSIGYSDIGRKGRPSLANLLGTSPPLFLALLVPCRYLYVAVCSSWTLLVCESFYPHLWDAC